MAVGVNVTSARSGTLRGEGNMDGTSMAAPQVAGAAAVILEKQPTLDPAGVKRVLLRSADDVGLSGPDNNYGYGALNLSAALSRVEGSEDRSDPEVFSLDLSRSKAMTGDPVMIEAGVSGDVSDVEVHVIGEEREIRIPMRDFDGNGVYTGRWETRFWAPGEYSIAVEAADPFGGRDTTAVPFVLT
ncbi:MAG: hypothetical protein APR56_05085 [Methanosaeta sp. SDB]|nr:MAG: hypothetical protein APR56_05085 [Methanosaeta sp. SDB]